MNEKWDGKWKEQARTLWQRVSDGFEKGMEMARKSAEVLAEKAEETAQITKYRLEIIHLEHQISRKFAKLGSVIYERSAREGEKNPMRDPEVINLIEDVKRLEAALAQTQSFLEKERFARV